MHKPSGDKRGRAGTAGGRARDNRGYTGRNKQRTERESAGVVERLLADLSPDDPAPADPLPPAVARLMTASPLSGRVAAVNAYLDANPADREALEADLADAWSRARGGRAEYLSAVADRRAELVSRARLHHVAATAPEATRDLLDSLAEYLDDPEGRRAHME